MTTGLDGATFTTGAAIQRQVTFDRAVGDTTTDLTSAYVQLELYRGDILALTLAVGSGLTRVTDSFDRQVFDLLITPTQVETLSANASAEIKYYWSITPVGLAETRAAKGNGYEGRFFVEVVPCP